MDLEEATGALLRVGAPMSQIVGADPDVGVAEHRFNGLGQALLGGTGDPGSKSSAIGKIDNVSGGAVRLADGEGPA